MEKKIICPECNGNVTSTTNDIYCTKCGLVIEEEFINYGAETTNPEKTEIMRRTGSPITYLNPFDTTYIDIKKIRRK